MGAQSLGRLIHVLVHPILNALIPAAGSAATLGERRVGRRRACPSLEPGTPVRQDLSEEMEKASVHREPRDSRSSPSELGLAEEFLRVIGDLPLHNVQSELHD